MASIERRVDGKGQVSWRVRFWEGGKRSGDRQSLTLYSEHEAKQWKARIDLAGQQWPVQSEVRAPQNTPTVADLTSRWLASRSGITPRTLHDYERDLSRYLLPYLGEIPVADVTVEDIGLWVRNLEAVPLRPKTVANILGTVATMFTFAVPTMRPDNPVTGTRRPRSDPQEMTILTRDEYQLIESKLPAQAMLIRTLVSTGARFGEITALQVQHLTLTGANPTVRIAQAWRWNPVQSTLTLGPPKTARARRTITIGPKFAEQLAAHIVGKSSADFVFPGKTGPLRNSHVWSQVWVPAINRAARCDKHADADKPCGCVGTLTKQPRLHDLRHTHVSWLIDAGHSLTVIQRRLGHTSIKTTSDTYGHLMPGADSRAAASIDDLLT